MQGAKLDTHTLVVWEVHKRSTEEQSLVVAIISAATRAMPPNLWLVTAPVPRGGGYLSHKFAVLPTLDFRFIGCYECAIIQASQKSDSSLHS